MEFIGKAFEIYGQVTGFLASNAGDVLSVVGAIYTIALLVVKITPSNADNEALDKAYKFVIGLIGKIGIKK